MKNADKLISIFFWFAMSVTGATGFAIGLVTVMQVLTIIMFPMRT
jgi:hypothetical protein